jgi:hypothetical protein
MAVPDAVAMLERGVAQAEMLADRFRAAAHLAWARALDRDPGGADQACEVADRALSELRVPDGGAFLFGFGAVTDLARAHLAAGRTERSESALRPLLEVAERSRWHEAAASAAYVLGLCHEAGDAIHDARRSLAQAIERAEVYDLPGVEWQARRALARLVDGEQAQRLRSESAAIVDRLAAGIDDDRLADGFRAAAHAQG